GFAWMELEIILTELLRRWRFELVPGQTITPKASITLRPEKPIRVVVHALAPFASEGQAENSPAL
ncbi:MAG TPA: hypothetical protein VFO40_06105, partial [Chthoniobacterales bacterium]|nr:hypothetical protein [Chthoniobacterales bacterium]